VSSDDKLLPCLLCAVVVGTWGLAAWLSRPPKKAASPVVNPVPHNSAVPPLHHEEKANGTQGLYCFHYKADGWRVSKVRNIGVVEGLSSRTMTGKMSSEAGTMLFRLGSTTR
jgi:hypothetical protein